MGEQVNQLQQQLQDLGPIQEKLQELGLYKIDHETVAEHTYQQVKRCAEPLADCEILKFTEDQRYSLWEDHECAMGICRAKDHPVSSTVIRLRECGHSFHWICFLPWWNEAETCPICRRDYNVLPPPRGNTVLRR